MKKQQLFPPSQALSQWSRWVTFLYGTAPHTRTHTRTHIVHKQGRCVHHTHTKKACCLGMVQMREVCRTGPGPPVENTYITRTRRRHVVYEWYRCARIYIYLQDWPRALGGPRREYIYRARWIAHTQAPHVHTHSIVFIHQAMLRRHASRRK